MNKIARDLKNAKNARLFVFVISIVMFVLAAGAPDAGGDFVR